MRHDLQALVDEFVEGCADASIPGGMDQVAAIMDELFSELGLAKISTEREAEIVQAVMLMDAILQRSGIRISTATASIMSWADERKKSIVTGATFDD